MEERVFEIICKVSNEIQFNNAVFTAHWSYERIERHNKIITYIGDGKLIASFEVYTAHPNGNEIHNVFDNGIVLIQNARTKKLVTELIARPNQIIRYWKGLNLYLNNTALLNKARQHQMKGWNNW